MKKKALLGLIAILYPLLLMPVTSQAEVVKSPGDHKNYRYLVLDNQMKVLLVSDKTVDKAAAALDVYIGSGSDPDDWLGLAHFLEHMLFLGTMRYPEAGEYQEFIKTHGGSNNAYTSFDHTNYYFSISADYLEPALDRFSRFFIDPTFDEVFVDRERSIVHSEYQARKKDEGRRLWDAEKQWMNPLHPTSRFSVGSLQTLRDREEMSARERLIAFYQQYYSANIMSLVLVGRESLDELEKMVVAKFADVPNHDASEQQFSQDRFNQDLFPARLNTVPEKEQNSIRFAFPVPSTFTEYDSKPLSYIANLLGHEGEGSVYSLIKNLGWAESLSAGQGYMDRVQGEFSVRIQLTESGLNHIDEIGDILFEALDLIRKSGVEEWRFEEQSRLSEIAFRFAQETDSGRLAQSLAHRLQVYPEKDILRGPYVMSRFDPDRIHELLDYLKPDNVSIHVSSKLLETDSRTEYYDVAYSIAPLQSALIKQWAEIESESRITLPQPNPYIPERLQILEVSSNASIPKIIVDTAKIQAWYQYDSEFGSPRAEFYFNIMTPRANRNPEDQMLTELYVGMVNSELKQEIYPAYLADLEYSLYRHGRGVSVRISGFEDKQSSLLTAITGVMKSPQADQNRFDIVRNGLIRNLNNVFKDAPSAQIVHESYRQLMDPYWTEQQRLSALETLTMQDVIDFVPQLFEKVDVVVLSHGDVSEDATIDRVGILESMFDKSSDSVKVERPGIRMLDTSKQYLRTLMVEHTDSALVNYYQGSSNSREERARVSLMRQLLESQFYTQLRTRNQVGYLVHASTITIDDTPGLVFSVQSPTHTPVEIQALFDHFIADFAATLTAMDQSTFDQIKAGLVARVLEKDTTLSERAARYWRDIDKEEFKFDSREQFADILNSLTKEQISEYFTKTIVDRGAELIVQSPGVNTDIPAALISGASYTVLGDAEESKL